MIKTLIIPIFNLLFIALPNPNREIIDLINDRLYDFLWNKKAKIKRDILVNQYSEGGLKMINLNAFIKALKTTWIRRILLSDSKWQEFIKEYVDLDKMVSCNIEYVRQKHT